MGAFLERLYMIRTSQKEPQIEKMIPYFLYWAITKVLHAYAGFLTYQAIESKDEEEQLKWLMYWAVFAAFTIIETAADLFLSIWFPFYYGIKLLFLTSLLGTPTKGGPMISGFLYRTLVKPMMASNENFIGETIAYIRDNGYTVAREMANRSWTMGQKIMSSAVSMAIANGYFQGNQNQSGNLW